jgi:hypothetical protein
LWVKHEAFEEAARILARSLISVAGRQHVNGLAPRARMRNRDNDGHAHRLRF